MLVEIAVRAIEAFAFIAEKFSVPDHCTAFLTDAQHDLHKLYRWSGNLPTWYGPCYIALIQIAAQDPLKKILQNVDGATKARYVTFCRRYSASEADNHARDCIFSIGCIVLQVLPRRAKQ